MASCAFGFESYFTDRSKTVLLLWIHLVLYVSYLSLKACGHLLEKGLPLGFLVCDVFLCFVTFLCGILGQVWYLIYRFLIFAAFLTCISGITGA